MPDPKKVVAAFQKKATQENNLKESLHLLYDRLRTNIIQRQFGEWLEIFPDENGIAAQEALEHSEWLAGFMTRFPKAQREGFPTFQDSLDIKARKNK